MLGSLVRPLKCKKAHEAAQWWSDCLAWSAPWVQASVLLQKERGSVGLYHLAKLWCP